MAQEIVCVHFWREWILYYDEARPEKQGRVRNCIRCPAVQRNEDPEPRVVVARLEEAKA